MVTATTVKGLADRLARAEALVADGAVFSVAGLVGYAVVRNGDGDSMYFVRFESWYERCTCPDFAHRQGKAGLPYKHILAAELALGGPPPAAAPSQAQDSPNGTRSVAHHGRP
ncbi:MAG TPA: hypothetical protein VMM78_03030 [Thermomicrobiales bacterium]|nr:hypothetical protein [Thermomicrobiales bacterium]